MPGGKKPKTPAVPGQVIGKVGGNAALNPQEAKKYCFGNSLHVQNATVIRLDIYNATQDPARHMSAPNESHMKAHKLLMKYVVGTSE